MTNNRSATLARPLALGLIAALLAMTGCTQNIRFNTDVEGADVWVNNTYIGKTPTTWKSRSGLPDTAYIKIEKEGYHPIKTATIDKTYRADVQLLWLVPGIVPYFVATARYEDDYVFHLQPIQDGATTAAATAHDRPTPAPLPSN